MQSERRLAVLRAIIEDYVATHEPVGSKALVDRHGLGVSPATVRNDMAALEDEGLIAQPHTSAGRIPTDKGYRMFVDGLQTIKPMSTAERRAIARFLEGAHDLDDVVQRSVRLLAQLTQQVAIVQYPTLASSTVRHIEVVPMAPTRVLLVLILSTGRVEQRLVDLPGELNEDALTDLRVRINRAAVGERITSAVTALADLPLQFDHHQRTPLAVVVSALIEAMSNQQRDERVVVGGTANLARFGDGYESTVRPMLEALEEHVVLLKLLGNVSSSERLSIRIGSEGPYQELVGTSVVASAYGPHDEVVGALGVVGPTRMDYPVNIAAVHAVATYVSDVLAQS
ncbi:MAG: heat-inducible transcriptional repressor HrcA [Marmoricola sp.]